MSLADIPPVHDDKSAIISKHIAATEETLYGIYGQPLDTTGDTCREPTPDGGYIIWKKEKDSKGKDDWLPFQYVPPDNRIEV